MIRVWYLLLCAVFLVLVPGTVAGLVPWWISGWEVRPPFLGLSAIPVIGTLLLVFGLVVLLEAVGRFALDGVGTPALFLPTRKLVVTGLYRHVRNPMYLAVTAIILGQGLMLGQVDLLIYAASVWASCHIFVLAYEEPELRRTHPEGYEAFFGNVPRWWPRMRPWHPVTQSG